MDFASLMLFPVINHAKRELPTANKTYATIDRDQYLLTSGEFKLNAQLKMAKNSNKAEQTNQGKKGSSSKTPNFSKAIPPPIHTSITNNIAIN